MPFVLMLAACAIVVVSSFMPWIRFMPQMHADFDAPGMAEFMREAMTATGWRGNVSLLGMTVPNWFVPILAIGIGAMALMRNADMWEAPRGLTIGLSAYCSVHLGFLTFVVLMVGSEAGLGFGAPLALLASLGMLGVAIFGWSNAVYETVSSQRANYQSYGAPRQREMHQDPPENAPAPPDFNPAPRERV